MNTQQEKELANKIKLQTEMHSVWLKHPETQVFLSILEGRLASHTKELQDGILISSDEKKEIKYRASISAVKAMISIAKDTGIFIVEQNKLTPNT